MNTQLNKDDLELLKAIQTIKKYHEKEEKGLKDFNQNVWVLIESLLKTASQPHICPRCGASLKLYVFF